MPFNSSNYLVPGVYTQTSTDNPTSALLEGLRLPMFIGTGSESLSQANLEVVRGSSTHVDQKVPQEDEAGRCVLSISQAGAITLGDFDGNTKKLQVKHYPIVNGNGTGTTATKSSAVLVTINKQPIVVLSMNAALGILELSTSPKVTDVVRVTYFFKRTDTLISNEDVSDQVDPNAPEMYGAVGSPYEIATDVNDTFLVTVDDADSVVITLPDSGVTTWTAAEVAAFINAGASTTSLVASTATDNYGNTVVYLVADRDIEIGNGTANTALGFANGQATSRSRVFYTFNGPIVDGTNGGVTTTDPADVTVKVKVGNTTTQVIPVEVDGANRAVTLDFAPEIGATVTITYYFNTWQDTFDYLAAVGVTDITQCGVSPGRTDYTDGVDFILKDDKIVWGTSFLVASALHTTGSNYLDDTQVSPTLVDVRQYLAPCDSVVDSTVSPAVESRVQFTLPLPPTTGNGRDTPLGATLYNTVANGRIDLPTNRPDLVYAYWGFGLEDAVARGRVTVNSVEGSVMTLSLPVPVGAEVFATFWYNTIQDMAYTLTTVTPGASGVGTYSVADEDGNTVLTPQWGTKSAGLAGITVQFPSGSERKPDVRFESPFDTTDYESPVEETVTVEFATVDSSLGECTVEGAGDYTLVLNQSDRVRFLVDGAALAGGAAGIDLGSVNGVSNLGFVATMVGAEVGTYDADSGYTTYEVDATNNAVNLSLDGVLVQATVTAAAGLTLASYVTAINTAALATPPEYVASGKFNSSTVVTASEYDQVRFHYVGDASGISGNLLGTIAVATYVSGTTLATAVDVAMAAAIAGLGAAFTGLAVGVSANSNGNLVVDLTLPTGVAATGTVTAATVLAADTVTINGTLFTAVTGVAGANQFDRTPGTDITTATNLVTAINLSTNWVGTPPVTATNVGGTSAIVTLTAASVGTGGNAITLVSSGATLAVSGALLTGGLNADANGYLEFITNATPARDFAVLAGIDTASATGGAQTKLLNGVVARRYTIVGDATGSLLHDRIILRSRLVPGFGTVYPQNVLSYAGVTVEGSSGAENTGLTVSADAPAGWGGVVQNASILGYVGFGEGQIAAATYGDSRDGQPAVVFYADGGTVDQNNVFKFTIDGTPITVEFTDGAGVAIADAASATVALGPASSALTVLGQIRAALTAAGVTSPSSRCVQEGAAIRFYSASPSTTSEITIGNGNANDTLGFVEADVAERVLVSPARMASGLMAHSGASVSAVLTTWNAPTATYFAEEALALPVTDAGGAVYLYVQSQGNLGAGSTSSIAFATPTTASCLLPGTGLKTETGDGGTGDAGTSGYFVTSSDPVNGSGTVNSSALNNGTGQDGFVGQTYRDAVTGLTFAVLDRSGGANYPSGETFTFRVRAIVTTDSNLPTNALYGVELVVANTLGVGAGDTATVNTYARSGNEPAVGDVFYVSYSYAKQDFTPQLFTKFATIEKEYGALAPEAPVSLASYLAILNGAVLVGIKQVEVDEDSNNDGVNDTASVAAFMTAVDDLEGPLNGGVLLDMLIALRGDSSDLLSYMTKHADIQSDLRHRAERTVLAGLSAGTEPRAAGRVASGIARTRFRMVYPDIVIVPLPQADGPDEDTLVDGTYLAAMLAGSLVSPNTDVATPWTNRRLVGAKRLARTLDAVEQNQVAVNGVTVLMDQGNIIKVRHGLTSDMSETLTKLPTIQLIVDEVQQQSRSTLERFIGTKFLPGVLSQIEGQLSNTLKNLVNAQILSAYTGVKANVDASNPTAAEVNAAVAPVFPLLYLLVNFSLRSSLS